MHKVKYKKIGSLNMSRAQLQPTQTWTNSILPTAI